MAAECRCYCGCERIDRQLSDESSDLTCRLCLMDRHLAQHPNLTDRVEELEFAVRAMQARLGVPVADRIPLNRGRRPDPLPYPVPATPLDEETV